MIRNNITNMNDEISVLNREIALLSEQNSMYNELKLSNIIDDVSYYEKTTAIQNSLNQLRDKRMKLIADDEDEMILERIRNLKSILNKLPKSLFVFDADVFNSIVDKVYVFSNKRVVFKLIAGFELGVNF